MTQLSYSIENAAKALDIGETTLKEAIANGELVKRYIKSKPVIPVTELQAWLDSRPPREAHQEQQVIDSMPIEWALPTAAVVWVVYFLQTRADRVANRRLRSRQTDESAERRKPGAGSPGLRRRGGHPYV